MHLPMTIIQTGMTMVILQAMVQPMVPRSSRITWTRGTSGGQLWNKLGAVG